MSGGDYRRALPRGPRSGRKRTDPLGWIEAVTFDPRLQALGGASFQAATVAVVRWANGDGRFWPRQRVWAEAAGLSLSALKRAVLALERAGVLEVEGHAGPAGQQGSSTYRFTVRPDVSRSSTSGLPLDAPVAPSGGGPWTDDGGRACVDDGGSPRIADPEQRNVNRGERNRGCLRDTGPTLAPDVRGETSAPPGSLPKARTATSLGNDGTDGLPGWVVDALGPVLDDADPPTPVQVRELVALAEECPDAFAAHAWDAYRSAGVRSPLAVLLWRIAHRDEVIEDWRATVDHWERAWEPRPGQTRGEGSQSS
jgi:hypothetical protein